MNIESYSENNPESPRLEDFKERFKHYLPIIEEAVAHPEESLVVPGRFFNVHHMFDPETQRETAVRIFKSVNSDEVAARQLNDRMIALTAGYGIDRVEQPLAFSEEGVVISTWVPGESLEDNFLNVARHATKQQFSELLDTVAALHQRVELDKHPSNLFYSVEDGFAIIDYQPLRPHRPPTSVAYQFGEYVARFALEAPHFEPEETGFLRNAFRNAAEVLFEAHPYAREEAEYLSMLYRYHLQEPRE